MTAKAYFGPVVEGFASNVTFVVEESPGLLVDYVGESLSGMKEIWPRALIGASQHFQTQRGASGFRIDIENPYLTEIRLHQRQYFFSKGDSKLVMTWTTHPSVAGSLAPHIDRSTKTLQFY